jgi:hypothetical protein
MQESREKGTRDDRIFSRGIEKLTLPPNPRWSTNRVLLPLKLPRLKCSLRVPVLHLRNGGSRTVYTKFFLGSHNLQELTKNPQSTKTV